jgi:hypothetical protein
VHRTPTLNALSYRFALWTDDARLGRHVDALFAGLRDHDGRDADHWYSLVTKAKGIVDVTRDGQVLVRGVSATDAVGWVVWHVNRSAVEAGDEHLVLHAGGVEADGRAVVLPGVSGSGKSTLCAALVQSGLAYLSDELVALDLATDQVLPYPKPITVKAGSVDALAEVGLRPRCDPDPGPDDVLPSAEEWQLAVGGGTGLRVGRTCPLGFVIVPRYVEGAVTSLSELSDTEAFFALAANAVNVRAHTAQSTNALGRVVARCRSAALTFSDLDEACRLVCGLVGHLAVGRAG